MNNLSLGPFLGFGWSIVLCKRWGSLIVNSKNVDVRAQMKFLRQPGHSTRRHLTFPALFEGYLSWRGKMVQIILMTFIRLWLLRCRPEHTRTAELMSGDNTAHLGWAEIKGFYMTAHCCIGSSGSVATQHHFKELKRHNLKDSGLENGYHCFQHRCGYHEQCKACSCDKIGHQLRNCSSDKWLPGVAFPGNVSMLAR